MEHTCKTVISCIEQGIQYTGRNLTKKHGRPYLLSSSYERNLLANSMQLKPKIEKIQKIQQGTNNEGKWKEERYKQVKQWLIMLNRLPE